MTLNTHTSRSPQRASRLLTGLGLLTLGLATALPASAQVVMTGPTLYHGDAVAPAGITLRSWGSGSVEEDTKGAFDAGTMSLRIVTHGLYQGASLQLSKPVDIGSYVTNKNAYLSFVFVPPAAPGPAVAGGTGSNPYGNRSKGGPGIGGPGGEEGGSPGLGSPGQGGNGQSGYGGRQPGGSGASGGKATAVKYQTPHAMQNLRVVLVTSTGRQLEMLLPLDSATDEGQWKRLSIPVSVIPGIKADDAQIKEIRLFGDTPGILRVGNIGVMVDETPITLEPISNRVIQRLDLYQFRAIAHAGITPLLVTWDWNAADGIQEEATGRFVTHAFRKESGYEPNTNKILDSVVTVTVRDLYGVKKPVSTKFSVHVTP